MKRISLSILLLSVVCGVTVHAQDPWQSYVQKRKDGPAPLPSRSALDEVVNNRLKPATKESRRPKETVYRPVVRQWHSNTVKDEREVIVTKDAIDKQNLVVKTIPPDKLTTKSNKVKPPVSHVQRSARPVDQTIFSRVQHAPQ